MTAAEAQTLQDRVDADLADIDPEDRRLVHALLFAVYRWRSNIPAGKLPEAPPEVLASSEYKAAWQAAVDILARR